MKSKIDTSAPKTMQRVGLNRSKKEAEFRRFSEIERENYRLLDRMSKIMVRGPADSIFGVHQHANCPALDYEKARQRRNDKLFEENKLLLKRIVNQKPYYSNKEWDAHAQEMHRVISHKCKFENRVFPLHPAPRKNVIEDLNSSVNASIDAAVRASVAQRRSESTLPQIAERSSQLGPPPAQREHGSTKKSKKGSRSASVPPGTNSTGVAVSSLKEQPRKSKGAGSTQGAAVKPSVPSQELDDKIPDVIQDGGELKPGSPGSRPPTAGYADDFE
jgi:hypothetical protein